MKSKAIITIHEIASNNYAYKAFVQYERKEGKNRIWMWIK